MEPSVKVSDNEVERLRKLVQDLEKQNTALRSQKLSHASTGSSSDGTSLMRSAVHRLDSGEADDGLLDLGSLDFLDDDVSWLCQSPTKESMKYTKEDLKKKYLASLESPDVLPTRRALYNRLRDIEKGSSNGASPAFSSRGSRSMEVPARATRSVEFGSDSSLNYSNYSDPGYVSHGNQSSVNFRDALASNNGFYPSDTGSYNSQSNHYSENGNNTHYSSATYRRPKKSDTPTEPPDDDVIAYKESSSSKSSTPTSGMSGDDNTRTRNKTRTINPADVLEAQRTLEELSDHGSSLSAGDNNESCDDLSVLPPESAFQKRIKPVGINNEDRKSKRESLDIQTLAKLQEQSLRESFTAVRKAAHPSGVPPLSVQELDSSSGSSNGDPLSLRSEERANQGSGTYRIKKSPKSTPPSTPVDNNNGIKSSVIDGLATGNTQVRNSLSSNLTTNSIMSPQIKSSLSPRSIPLPKSANSIPKPRTSLPQPRQSSGRIPQPGGTRASYNL